MASEQYTRGLIRHLRVIFNKEGLEGGRVSEVLNYWRYKLRATHAISPQWLEAPGVELIANSDRKFLLSYVQPIRGTSAEQNWVIHAARVVELHASELANHSYRMLYPNGSPSDSPHAEPSVWVDKLASVSRPEDSQSVWAPLCNMQYFVHPVLVLLPTDQDAYRDVERADPAGDLAETTVISLFNAMRTCSHCAPALSRFVFLGPPPYDSEDYIVGNVSPTAAEELNLHDGFLDLPLVLLSVWARTWPGAEAMCAATGNHLFATVADTHSLLATYAAAASLRALCLTRELGVVPPDPWLAAGPPACDSCAAAIDPAETWDRWRRRARSGLALVKLVLERLRVVGEDATGAERALNQWRARCTTGFAFQDVFLSRMMYVRDHLTLYGGATAPCFDPGDKLTTVCLLDMVMSVVAHGLFPNMERMTDMRECARLVLVGTNGNPGVTTRPKLCGQSVEVHRKGVVVIWNVGFASSMVMEDERAWVCPGLGLLSRKAVNKAFANALNWEQDAAEAMMGRLRSEYEERATQVGTLFVLEGDESVEAGCEHVRLRRVGRVMASALGEHVQQWDGKFVTSTLGQIFLDGQQQLAGIAIWRERAAQGRCEGCRRRYAVVVADGSLESGGVEAGTAVLIYLNCWNEEAAD